MSSPPDQFSLTQRQYLAGLDFFTWTRHFHVLRDLLARVGSDGAVFEVGTGDGVLRRCLEPFVGSYTVMDLNPHLKPEVLGNLLEPQPQLAGRFDAAVCTEVLEHLPFADFARALAQLAAVLRPGGRLFLTVPHRKGHLLVVTPRQKLRTWRFPFGTTSLSEAYNRFVRRRIWIDPNHCWEIGDGTVTRARVEAALAAQGFATEAFSPLPYCDYWVLVRPS
ncbi:MAG: class I SAM-dependent methyltransferase [Piscinibacter sp.]|uniref:class I SAM-dependent methyltransferase n=1 Tax=Piscinibacter sp. TaxID=1903157 RepID=UPI00259037B5|nr:class I SAM-dependent methyltransferase [Piscinibacter sp.]MCW5666929.1 class I SAM-dependent methyltransferase [Piscinibacter sp.]